jgi:Protein of unknown function (DUF4065)
MWTNSRNRLVIIMTSVTLQKEVMFRFHIRKSIEASAQLLKLHEKSIECISLLRMLYLCDRLTLEKMDQTIAGGLYLCTNFGLIVESVRDLMEGKSSMKNESALWYEFFSCTSESERHISLNPGKDPGSDNLCQIEKEIIREIYDKYSHLNPSNEDWTMKTPEWKRCTGKSNKVTVPDILKQLGRTDEDIDEICQIEIREQSLNEFDDT